jgi:hypothetical protein
MREIYPAGTTTIRNTEERFNYFLVIKPESLVMDIPQREYFVYKFKISLSAKRGIKELKDHFFPIVLEECREISDLEYSTGDFIHPDYISQNKTPIKFKLKEIPIYFQSTVREINLDKDLYKLGSKPPIKTPRI